MYFVAHQSAKCLIDQLVSCQRSHAGEFIGDNEDFKVRIVVAGNSYDRIVKARFDQSCDLVWIHTIK